VLLKIPLFVRPRDRSAGREQALDDVPVAGAFADHDRTVDLVDDRQVQGVGEKACEDALLGRPEQHLVWSLAARAMAASTSPDSSIPKRASDRSFSVAHSSRNATAPTRAPVREHARVGQHGRAQEPAREVAREDDEPVAQQRWDAGQAFEGECDRRQGVFRVQLVATDDDVQKAKRGQQRAEQGGTTGGGSQQRSGAR
jgi:hypothetical protein